MELSVEVEGAESPMCLPEGGEALIGFMSFAVARGFGAEHPFLALADRLETEHGVRLGPLTTFYEGRVDDAEDAEKLDMAWQDAGQLAESLARMSAALGADGRFPELLSMANAEGLPGQAETLRSIAEAAAKEGRRVRLSYAL